MRPGGPSIGMFNASFALIVRTVRTSVHHRKPWYKHANFNSEILNRSPPVRLSAMLDPLDGSREEGCISAFTPFFFSVRWSVTLARR